MFVPHTNEQVGFPTDMEAVHKHHASEGVLVQDSPTLVEAGAAFAKGLFAVKKFESGEKITACWGKYVTRVTEEKGVRSIELVKRSRPQAAW